MHAFRYSSVRSMVALLTTLTSVACEEAGVSPTHETNDEAEARADAFAGDPRDVPESEARLRVSIVAGTPDLQDVAFGDLKLCDGAGCIRADVDGRLEATTDAHGTLVADLLIPSGSYSRLEVDEGRPSHGTTPVAAASLALQQVLKVEGGMRYELFLELSQDKGSAQARFAAANIVALDAEQVALYRPGHETKVTTTQGFEIALAEDSSDTAFVMGITELDIGGVSRHVTLSPRMALQAPASVMLPIDESKIARGLTLADFEVRLNDTNLPAVQLADSDASEGGIEFELPELGDLRLITMHPYVETLEGDAFIVEAPEGQTISKAATDTCAKALAAKLNTYNTTLSKSQAIRITDCESVFPFVHIVMVNLGLGGATAPSPRYPWIQISASKTSQGPYVLRTIAGHVTGWQAKLGINGFTWSGDPGTADLQVGTLNGTVYLAGSQASKTTSAEAIIGFSATSGSGTGSKFFAKAANTNPSLSPYNRYAQGSTTSIMKSGACSRTDGDGPENLWSAIGIGGNRLVMVSSTSGNDDTEAYDLCALFSALKATDGAIRLDGGPSAAIHFGGKHLNPLTFPWNTKYGSARRVISAIVAK